MLASNWPLLKWKRRELPIRLEVAERPLLMLELGEALTWCTKRDARAERNERLLLSYSAERPTIQERASWREGEKCVGLSEFKTCSPSFSPASASRLLCQLYHSRNGSHQTAQAACSKTEVRRRGLRGEPLLVQEQEAARSQAEHRQKW